jgi:molybdopterin converting factor small subunit
MSVFACYFPVNLFLLPIESFMTILAKKERRNKMKINIKCFATLSEAGHCDYKDSRVTELDENADVNELIAQLGLPKDKVEIIFVNGKRVDSNQTLSDGDQVGFFPAVGGM